MLRGRVPPTPLNESLFYVISIIIPHTFEGLSALDLDLMDSIHIDLAPQSISIDCVCATNLKLMTIHTKGPIMVM